MSANLRSKRFPSKPYHLLHVWLQLRKLWGHLHSVNAAKNNVRSGSGKLHLMQR